MAEAKKTKAADKKPASKPATDDMPAKDGLNISNIFWGGLFLLAGLLLLLSNLGLVAVDWGALWKLWPVAIIVGGLSILSLRGWVAGVVYGLATVVIVLLTWATLTGNIASDKSGVTTDQFSISQSGSSVERLDVKLEAGASSLNLSSHDGNEMVRGQIESRLSELKHQSVVSDGVQTVTLSQEQNWQWFNPGSFNDLDILLNKQIPTRLSVDAGASSIKADLSNIMLDSLLIDSGASSVDIKLGDKRTQTDVTIDTGVSSVKLQVPRDSGVKLTIDAGLSSRELPSGYEKIDDHIYQSVGYDQATNKISLSVDIGVSSFKLTTY